MLPRLARDPVMLQTLDIGCGNGAQKVLRKR
jgi:hypothetical protein